MLITAEQAAGRLQVSTMTIYRWIKDKQNPIPHHKKMGTLRFDEDEIIEWFKGKK